MKKWKKTMAAMVAVVTLLSLFAAGCKKSEPTEKRKRVKKTRNTTVSDTEAPEPDETDPTPSETNAPILDSFEFTESNFPYIYCSYETKQMGVALSSSLLGLEAKDAGVFFLETLLNNRFVPEEDVVFSFCTPDMRGRLMTQPTDFEEKVIAQDALTFIVSKTNPVDSLTSEQVKKIYLGEITNWKDVGGNDEPIVPFARSNYSVQTKLLEDLVLGDVIPNKTKVPTIMEPGDDYGYFFCPLLYDNSEGAITYVEYYYTQECLDADKVKILKIDDVAPEHDTIKTGKYPFTFDIYALISKSLDADSPERVMFDFLTTEEGKKVIESAGYVASENTTAPTSDVKCDPAAFTAGEKHPEVYTRASDEPIMEFVPGDYGTIWPFLGSYKTSIMGSRQRLYGFMDAQGRIICDPIFSAATRLKDGMYLVKGYDELPRGHVGIISKNGAAFTGMKYDFLFEIDGAYTLINEENDGLQLYTFDEKSGTVTEGPFLKMKDMEPMYCFSTILENRYIYCENDLDEEYFLIDGKTGEDIYADRFGDTKTVRMCGELFEVYKDDGMTVEKVVDLDGNVVFSEPDSEMRYVSREFFTYGSYDGDMWIVLSKEGEILGKISNKNHDITSFGASDDYFIVIRGDEADVFDKDMISLGTVEAPADGYVDALNRPEDYYGNTLGEGTTDPIIISKDRVSSRITNLKTGKTEKFSSSDYTMWYQMPGIVFKSDQDEWTIIDSSDFHVIAEGEGFVDVYIDNVTQKYYMAVRNFRFNSSVQIIDAATGETVLNDLPNPRNEILQIWSIDDGRIYYEMEYPYQTYIGAPNSCAVVDLNGNILFWYNGLAFVTE